jgi:hypothetical protein
LRGMAGSGARRIGSERRALFRVDEHFHGDIEHLELVRCATDVKLYGAVAPGNDGAWRDGAPVEEQIGAILVMRSAKVGAAHHQAFTTARSAGAGSVVGRGKGDDRRRTHC